MSLFYTNVATGQTLPFALSDVAKTRSPQQLLRSNLASVSAAPVAAGRSDVRPNGKDGFTFVPALVSTGMGLTNSYQVTPTAALRRLQQEQEDARVPMPLRGKSSAYGNVVQTPNLIPVWEQHVHKRYETARERDGMRPGDFDREVIVGRDGGATALAEKAAAPASAPITPTMPYTYSETPIPYAYVEQPRELPANAFFGALNYSEDGMPFCYGLKRDDIYKNSSPVENF